MIASIDIGTSYSSICILGPDGKAQPVDISTGASMFGSKYSLPSAVFVEDGGNVLVGQAAMNSRKHKPQNFRMEFKRNLGENIPILLGERSFKPEELYTELFRHMKARAEKVSGSPIEKTYLTCPASYGEARRDKLRTAAKAAGLFDLELVDEPTAAAMCYCAQGYIRDGQTLLVYDFGGGTFDVSLIKYQNGEFQLLSEPTGLDRCGGMDVDYLIAQDMRRAIEAEIPGAWESLQKNPGRFLRFTSQLSELAVKAKHHLSDADRFEEYIEVGMDDVRYQLTVERFNEMIASLVGQTLQTCRRALDEAGVAPAEVSAVLLVGGTSRIPLVQEMARKITGRPALCAIDLELIVAQGALMYHEYQKRERARREQARRTERKKEAPPASQEQEVHKQAPEKKQTTTDSRDQTLSAEEYYELGKKAADRQAWIEASEYYRKAAILGHAFAWRELEHISAGQKGEDIRAKISITFEEMASGCTKEVTVRDSNQTKTLKIAIPAGIEDGQKLRFQGQGGPGKGGGPQGDLYVTATVLPHSVFRRNGLDVCCDAQVPYIVAEKGGEIAVPALEQKLRLRISPITKDGTVYKIQGKGIPALDGHTRGDLLVTIHIQTPAAEECFQIARECDQHHHMKEATNWYQIAAEQGHTGAAYQLGLCYASSWGVAADYSQAAKWYRAAAENGHSQAAYLLGTYYEEGKGVPKDSAQARQWFKRAAELGHRDALREIGSLQRENQQQKLEQLVERFLHTDFYPAILKKYLWPDKINTLSALKKSCKVPDGETVLLAHDDTVSQRGSDGFVVTTKGIYTNNWFLFGHDIFFTGWQEFMDSTIEPANVKSPVTINLVPKSGTGGVKRISCLNIINGTVTEAQKNDVREALKKFWIYLQNYLRGNSKQ